MAFVVIDYHKGNLASVARGVELAGASCLISDAPASIAAADALLLPGVGSFADASAYLHRSGQAEAIIGRIAQGVPFLGICLGLQLLFERGDEGVAADSGGFDVGAGECFADAQGHVWARGLGLLEGYCRRVDAADPQGARHKIPHVGWNQVRYLHADDARLQPLFAAVPSQSNFYFTHSYQAEPTCADDVLADVTHAQPFACAVNKDRVFGVQFHPEKSSHKGLQVLRNFVGYVRGLD